MLYHVRGPLVDLRLLISVAANCVLYRIFDDCADLRVFIFWCIVIRFLP